MLGAMVPLRSRSAASAPEASASTSISISISSSSPPDASASTSSSAPATASAAPLATVSQLRRCRSHPAHDPALPPHQLFHCDARTTTTATWSGAATVWRGDAVPPSNCPCAGRRRRSTDREMCALCATVWGFLNVCRFSFPLCNTSGRLCRDCRLALSTLRSAATATAH